jgi:hypothetical protein
MKASLVLISFLLSNLVTFAQNEMHWLPDQPGKWSYSHKIHGEIEQYNFSANETSKYKRKIDTVVETLHQNPVLKNPVGFDPSVYIKIQDGERKGFKSTSYTNEIVGTKIAVQFCPLYKDESGNIKKHCMEVSACEVSLNCPKFTAESYINYEIDGYNEELTILAQRLNKIFIKPLVVKELADGVTAYNSGIIVIANSKHPYWIPVTAGELFEMELNYWQLKNKIDKQETYATVIDAIKSEKAALTPEELELPAYKLNSNISAITIKQNDSQYMRFNPDYMDKKLPRSDVQLITVYTLTQAYSNNCQFKDVAHLKHCEFVKLLDVNALKALLDVK